MDKRDWQIYYSSYEGPQKRAVELVSRDIGKYILRDQGIYAYHVLACESVGQGEHSEGGGIVKGRGMVEGIRTNAVVLGTLEENAILQKYIRPCEVPKNGYVVKVMDNPECAGRKLALLCGDSPTEVFYGAADFVDDYLAGAVPVFDAYIHLKNELFLHPLPDYFVATAPDFQTRSVFTWGHPINDYRTYIADLARLKLNQLIIWNDFLPVNAEDVVAYAHSFGMEVLWGFAWGWNQKCGEADVQNLEALKDSIIEQFNHSYRGRCGDGIYFQSFTELPFDRIGETVIAQAVTRLVNMTAGEILAQNPGLHIQFGLHASSVKDHLEDIAVVDERVEIVWEDCGSFPYKACGMQFTDDNDEKLALTDRISGLRQNGKYGLVYKCQVTMDWSRGRMEHQAGSYVMGKMSQELMTHDEKILRPAWRVYGVEWLKYGEEAWRLTRQIHEKSGGGANMCLAGMFSGGIWFPTALCAQMFWNCHEPYDVIQRKVLLRDWIRF